MDVLAAAAQGSAYDVVLAMLNVVQTIALAYLAADRGHVARQRRQGIGTRVSDPPPNSQGRSSGP